MDDTHGHHHHRSGDKSLNIRGALLHLAAADLRCKLHDDFGIEHATFEWRTPQGQGGECNFK